MGWTEACNRSANIYKATEITLISGSFLMDPLCWNKEIVRAGKLKSPPRQIIFITTTPTHVTVYIPLAQNRAIFQYMFTATEAFVNENNDLPKVCANTYMRHSYYTTSTVLVWSQVLLLLCYFCYSAFCCWWNFLMREDPCFFLLYNKTQCCI